MAHSVYNTACYNLDVLFCLLDIKQAQIQPLVTLSIETSADLSETITVSTTTFQRAHNSRFSNDGTYCYQCIRNPDHYYTGCM